MKRVLIYVSIVFAIYFIAACTSCNNESKKEIDRAVKAVEDKGSKSIAFKPKRTITNKTVSDDEPKPFVPENKLDLPGEKITAEEMGDMKINELRSIQPKIMKETQKIPECLEVAQTKEEAFACSKALRELNAELALSMGDFSEQGMEGYDENFVWDEKTKINMIQEIEAGIAAMQDMQTCMETSSTADELDQCLKPEDQNESSGRI